MHPRAGLDARQQFERLGFAITEELWTDSAFIGHYSSLLGLAPDISPFEKFIETYTNV